MWLNNSDTVGPLPSLADYVPHPQSYQHRSSHSLCSLLPAAERYRSLPSRSTGLSNSFFYQAVRTMNLCSPAPSPSASCPCTLTLATIYTILRNTVTERNNFSILLYVLHIQRIDLSLVLPHPCGRGPRGSNSLFCVAVTWSWACREGSSFNRIPQYRI